MDLDTMHLPEGPADKPFDVEDLLDPEAVAKARARDIVRQKQGLYMQVFGTPAGKEVLADLAPFCRATASCFSSDHAQHALAEGRREVWLRIQDFLTLANDELIRKRFPLLYHTKQQEASDVG